MNKKKQKQKMCIQTKRRNNTQVMNDVRSDADEGREQKHEKNERTLYELYQI